MNEKTKIIIVVTIVIFLAALPMIVSIVYAGLTNPNNKFKHEAVINNEEKNTEESDTISELEDVKDGEEVVSNDTEMDLQILEEAGYSKDDIFLLAQIIHAEAKGEPFEGKVAVGNVVLNRVFSDKFPNSIGEVIFQPRQFQPVTNGTIYCIPSDEALDAAIQSVHTNLVGDSLYFYNPVIATDKWIKTREVIMEIGNHAFAI